MSKRKASAGRTPRAGTAATPRSIRFTDQEWERLTRYARREGLEGPRHMLRRLFEQYEQVVTIYNRGDKRTRKVHRRCRP